MTREEKQVWLIRALQKEMPRYARYAIPEDREGQWQLLRGLFNVRPPMPASPEFLRIQGELLRELTEEKGVVTMDFLAPCEQEKELYLWQGDITRLEADAIVNAANSQMLGCFRPNHSCIDNIIHTMAGVELRLKCAELMEAQGHEEPTGQAKITPAYHLPSKYVIHTVGPIVDGPLTPEHSRLLASCYRSCLEIAAENGCGSIAFCCISTGVFGFPQREAAEIAVKTVKAWKSETGNGITVIFNVFKDQDLTIYQDILQ
jgi:O-acetyl-ADP-ribose deacetylase (regulator of RNase III)